MSNEWLFQVRTPTPVSVGTGFIALDILIDDQDDSLSYSAGGSCGNVLTILAYLGWNSYPVAYLGKDEAAQLIVKDLAKWKVSKSFVTLGRKSGTPIVVERLERRNGLSTHRFEFICPNCNSPLPRNRPIPIDNVPDLVENLPSSQVFYFDRASKSALAMASFLKKKGALIMFEPASLRTDALFRRCLSIAHIVKYSYEQIDGLGNGIQIPLEIQTHGAEGLRYRHQVRGVGKQRWRKIPAFHVSKFVDSAGAGDWCTAGVLHLLGQSGANGFERAQDDQIEFAMKFGEALAALDCGYEGARGLMYEMEMTGMRQEILRLMNGATTKQSLRTPKSPSLESIMKELCPACTMRRKPSAAASKMSENSNSDSSYAKIRAA